MKELSEIRAELDQVDRELVTLVEKRMQIVCDVAAYKLEHNMPVLDASRESQVLASRKAMLNDAKYEADIQELFTMLMRQSRAHQEAWLREAAK